ncbi:unnamed protein product [Effrenium voratum]|uniref:Uncharacterized protein n=1 Tax=Effrenium voratum TaxID=2562239 RepID=A0AA36JLT1_9DINO|nr:unnamed protein product [Effrenium voratum]CAJ1419669.1 unnamed protein product [Effrenium voratum]
MKGAREYRRNRDNFNTYDMDPDSQKYMHALLKLVQLAQCLQPNEDASKNCAWPSGSVSWVFGLAWVRVCFPNREASDMDGRGKPIGHQPT